MSLTEYFAMNCDPGIFRYYTDVVRLNADELRREQVIWKKFVRERIPQVYPGMRGVIERQKQAGGLICVVSHSDRDHVLRDYAASGLPAPDLVFGGDVEEAHRKPSPWPVEQILRQFDLRPEDALIVDDLIPGLEMAAKAGVEAVAACWAHHTPQVQAYVRTQRLRAFDTPEQLAAWLASAGNSLSG